MEFLFPKLPAVAKSGTPRIYDLLFPIAIYSSKNINKHSSAMKN